MKLVRILTIILLFTLESSYAQDKPNIILFLVDDLGWTDLKTYGSDLYESPNIDDLAASGMKFTNAYSACTVCSPSRASILTGKNPARLQITDWITGYDYPNAKLLSPNWTKYLALEETTIAEVLKERGYATASIGKWHLGDDIKYYPENQGFDLNSAGTYQGQPPSFFSPYNISRLKNGPKGEYITDRLTIEAENFIKANAEKPFFLYMPFFAVHTPLQAKESDIEYFKSKLSAGTNHMNPTYAAMIKSMDESVGRIMSLIDQMGIRENTLIVFTSDNGGLIAGRNDPAKRVTSNVPLRLGKGSNYEGGVRVPAIFSWKGKIKPGSISDVPIIGTDLFPTFAGVANATLPFPKQVDGKDLMPLLSGRKIKREALYWHYPHYHTEGGTPHSTIRKGDWKLIYSYESGKSELYNLREDISETRDLSADEPAKARSMLKQLEQWKQKIAAQNPIPNPDYLEAKKNITAKPLGRTIDDPFNVN